MFSGKWWSNKSKNLKQNLLGQKVFTGLRVFPFFCFVKFKVPAIEGKMFWKNKNVEIVESYSHQGRY